MMNICVDTELAPCFASRCSSKPRLTGLIYLENNLTSGAFTPARIALLEVLASDAAISLENARLYRDLQVREARVRRLIDANIIGISIWHADGRIWMRTKNFFASSGMTGKTRLGPCALDRSHPAGRA